MNERKWTQWSRKVESGGIEYESAAALVSELRLAYLNDKPTRDALDLLPYDVELTARGIGSHERYLVIIPIDDVRR